MMSLVSKDEKETGWHREAESRGGSCWAPRFWTSTARKDECPRAAPHGVFCLWQVVRVIMSRWEGFQKSESDEISHMFKTYSFFCEERKVLVNE